jgi:hypothetical protein
MDNEFDNLIIPIPSALVRGYIGNCSGLYEMDFNGPPTLGASIEEYYLKQGLDGAKRVGDLEVLYFAFSKLLIDKETDLNQFHLGEQEWDQSEMHWFISELHKYWFGQNFPQLDQFLPFVRIEDMLVRAEWLEKFKPKIDDLLPRISSA